MQFSFMLGRSTIGAIYILRQSRRNILFGKIKKYFVFADLEKAFDWISCSVLWYAKRKLGID